MNKNMVTFFLSLFVNRITVVMLPKVGSAGESTTKENIYIAQEKWQVTVSVKITEDSKKKINCSSAFLIIAKCYHVVAIG